MNRAKIFESALSILGEIFVALIIAGVSPFFVRYFLLPNSIHHQYSLNVVFNTCDDLHGVCSFPSGTLEYEKNQIFSPNIVYYLNVRLKFADISTTNRLGLFQNLITTHDENEKQIGRFIKSSYVKEPGFLTKATWCFFFPLYFLGFFHDYSTLDIPMSADYVETVGKESVKLIYTLQDKFANIEEAQIIVTARFGLIRHLLYYWPTFSYCLIFLTVFLFCSAIFLAKFAYLQFGKEPTRVEEQEESTEIRETQRKGVKKEVVVIVKKEEGFAPDEYVPDNVDEEPENEILQNFPKLENLRKRK